MLTNYLGSIRKPLSCVNQELGNLTIGYVGAVRQPYASPPACLTFWFGKNTADVSADLVVKLRVLCENRGDLLSEWAVSDPFLSLVREQSGT
jgi:hypothetical protein